MKTAPLLPLTCYSVLAMVIFTYESPLTLKSCSSVYRRETEEGDCPLLVVVVFTCLTWTLTVK